MGNRLSPGCCCGGCQAFLLGFSSAAPLVPGGLPTQITTNELLQANLDAVSLAGHDVTVAESHERSFALAAGGRWATKSAYSPVHLWDLFYFWNNYVGDDSVDADVDIDVIWALENAEDIYDDTSVILTLTYTLATNTQTITLRSDWPGTTYPFGAVTSQQQSVILGDTLSPGPVYSVIFSEDSVWTELGLQPAFVNPPPGLHRPLQSSAHRRMHVVNNNDYPWYFDGFLMAGRNDDRTINRDAPTSPCQRIISPNRSMIGNEPFAIQVDYDSHIAPPRLFSLANGDWPNGQAKATAEVQHELVTQPDMISIPFEYEGDEIFFDAVDTHLEFICDVAGMEIVSLDANGKPATVAVRITFTAYGNGWVPVLNPFNSSLITFDQITSIPSPTIIDCVLPAWDRGQFPTLTIVPDGSGGVTVNGSPATLVTAWPTPQIPVRRRYFWEEVVFFDETFGSYVQGDVEFASVARTIQIVGALPDL